jgi:choline dehydrogenase-like flavoprotein
VQTARITPCGKYQDPITYGDNFLKFGRDEENREPHRPPDCEDCLESPLWRQCRGYEFDRRLTVYKFEAQPSLDGRAVLIMQGHVLGGNSSVNAMTYTRGVPGDYAKWDEATGGAGWDWDSLLPYFRKQEGNQRLNNEAHGVDGPLKVSDASEP